MGGCGSLILLPVFVPVCGSGLRVGGQGRWCGRCVCGGRVGTQHSEGMGKQRWQVEVRAEQFSTVGVEVQRGTGSRVGPA